MTLKLLLALVLTASLGAPVGYVFYKSSLSSDNWVYRGGSPTNWKDGGAHSGGGSTHGVPGPLVGAGFPVIAIGYGAYWFVRRYRRKSEAV
jgi:hypothetical protein